MWGGPGNTVHLNLDTIYKRFKVRSLISVSDEEIDIMLRAADINGDKRIDLHEFG